MIDAYATQPHYLHHILPIWQALDPADRGTLYVTGTLAPFVKTAHKVAAHPPPSHRPIMVAGAPDLRPVGKRPVVFAEHGTGQTYLTDHASYAGGPHRERVRLFLCPNERVAAANQATYPNVPAVVVGSPRVEQLRRMLPGTSGPVVLAWHWNCDLVPETRTAFPQYRRILSRFAGAVGHGHPRMWGTLERDYRAAGLRPMQWWDDVIRMGPSVVVADNTSVMWEAAALGIPVVVVNASWYRRDVEHGLRFWECSDVGPNVNHPDDLLAVVNTVAEWAGVYDVRRREVAGLLYGQSDRSAWRAADAIRSHGMT